VRPRVRQTSARWPVSLQGSSAVSSRTLPFGVGHDSSSLAGTTNRAHPRDAPSTSERSSSRVPDASRWPTAVSVGASASLDRTCSRLLGRDLRGVLPLQSFVPAFRPLALTDLHGDSRNRDRARPREALRDGVAPHASGRPFRRARSLGERTTSRPVGSVSVCDAHTGPPRGDRPFPPRPSARTRVLRLVPGVSKHLASARLESTP